jgi:hypothetical protein
MSVEEQMEQLPLMMKEKQKETKERLARKNTSDAKWDTALALRMLISIYETSDTLLGQVNEVLTFMDSKELEYPRLMELSRDNARLCSTALLDLLRFLESD